MSKLRMVLYSMLGIALTAALISGRLSLDLVGNVVLAVVLFVVVMSVLVTVHEFAHFLVGKHLGAEPEVFSVGMGSVVYKFNWLGAEFRLSALPVGGYVKFKKVQFDGENGSDSPNDKIKPSHWIWIALAGPVSNLVLSFIVFFTMTLLALKDVSVHKVENNVYQIQMNCGTETNPCSRMGILASRTFFSKNVSNEVRVLDLNNFKLTKTDSVTMTVEEKSLLENLKLAWVGTIDLHRFFFHATGQALVKLVQKPHENYQQMSGPVGIASSLNTLSKIGIEYVWLLFGAISFSLGFMNLLPLSLLDGGRVLLAIYQSTVNPVVNAKVLNVLNVISYAGVLSLMVMGLIADIGRML